MSNTAPPAIFGLERFCALAKKHRFEKVDVFQNGDEINVNFWMGIICLKFVFTPDGNINYQIDDNNFKKNLTIADADALIGKIMHQIILAEIDASE
jgi:hypothetical protein